MIKDYFLLALGNIKHRGIRSWLTMLGIFIGIAAVVSLISLGQGLQTAIVGQFSSLSTDTLTIQNSGTGFGPPGSTSVKKLNEHDLDIIKQVSGIEIVIPRLIRVVSFEYNNFRNFKYVASMPKDSESLDFVYTNMGLKIDSGKLLSNSDTGKVLLGADFLDENEFGKPLRVGSSVEIQGKKFQVTGILKKASTFQINSAIFMTEDDLKDILNLDDEIDLIVARVQNPDDIEKVAEDITRKMRKDRNLDEGKEDFSVETPLKSIDSVNTILNIINVIVVGIAAISLIVGGIGIMNTMYTSVLERTKEIGVMKAVGARNSDVLSIFLIESGLLGLVGGIIGAIIGLGFAFVVSFSANSAFGETIISVSISYPLLSMAIAFSFLIGLLSGIVPALQASKMKPVEALRA